MGALFLNRGALALLAGALALRPAHATEDTDTPGPGRWEINLGASQERQAGLRVLSLPDWDVNYGLGEHAQLMLAAPYVRLAGDGAAARSGWGGATAGVKWRLFGQEDGQQGWSLAWFPRFSWNVSSSAAARGLASPGRSLLLPLVAGVRRGDTALYAELGRNLVQRGPHEWQAGLKLVHQCLPRLECRLELDHSRVPRDGGQTLAGAGGKWTWFEGVILQGSAGRDIAGGREGRRKLVLYLGVQLLR